MFNSTYYYDNDDEDNDENDDKNVSSYSKNKIKNNEKNNEGEKFKLILESVKFSSFRNSKGHTMTITTRQKILQLSETKCRDCLPWELFYKLFCHCYPTSKHYRS